MLKDSFKGIIQYRKSFMYQKGTRGFNPVKSSITLKPYTSRPILSLSRFPSLYCFLHICHQDSRVDYIYECNIICYKFRIIAAYTNIFNITAIEFSL